MINDAMRDECFARISSERARTLYDRLCRACDTRDDGITDADQAIVGDIAYEEQIKELLEADIQERGIGKEQRNGRQTYWAENKSLGQLRAYSEQQRKQLSELRLTPVRRKAAVVNIEDDFDSFPD